MRKLSHVRVRKSTKTLFFSVTEQWWKIEKYSCKFLHNPYTNLMHDRKNKI